MAPTVSATLVVAPAPASRRGAVRARVIRTGMDSWNRSGVSVGEDHDVGTLLGDSVDEIGEWGVGAEVDDSPSVAVQDDAEGQQSAACSAGSPAEGRWA